MLLGRVKWPNWTLAVFVLKEFWKILGMQVKAVGSRAAPSVNVTVPPSSSFDYWSELTKKEHCFFSKRQYCFKFCLYKSGKRYNNIFSKKNFEWNYLLCWFIFFWWWLNTRREKNIKLFQNWNISGLFIYLKNGSYSTFSHHLEMCSLRRLETNPAHSCIIQSGTVW